MLNRGVLAAVYSLTAVFGLLSVSFPSPSVWGLVGLHLVYLYGILLLVGGLAALVAVALPNYKLELIALWPVVGGFLMYDIALWGLFAERVGVIDGLAPPYGPALAVAILSLFLIAKILLLIKKNHQLVRAADNNGLD